MAYGTPYKCVINAIDRIRDRVSHSAQVSGMVSRRPGRYKVHTQTPEGEARGPDMSDKY